MVISFFKNEEFSAGPLLILAGGIIIGSLGPFGQIERFALFERIGLWVVYLSVGLPLIWAIQNRFSAFLKSDSSSSLFLNSLLTTMTAAPALFLIVELLGLSQGRAFPPDSRELVRALLEVFGTVFLVALLMAVLKAKKPSIGDARPEALNGPIYALQAEGHYTRVHGPHGDKLLDMTFSNAMAATTDLDGAQVHRSWWVARGFAGAVRRRGSAKEFELPGELIIPIARRRLAQLRQQGWKV